jgi:hypothetical protein
MVFDRQFIDAADAGGWPTDEGSMGIQPGCGGHSGAVVGRLAYLGFSNLAREAPRFWPRPVLGDTTSLARASQANATGCTYRG